MKLIQVFPFTALALLAGAPSADLAYGHSMPRAPTPSTSIPRVNIPRVDTSSVVRGGVDAAKKGTSTQSSGDSKTNTATGRSSSATQTLVLIRPDGKPLLGPDGKPATLVVTRFTTELTPTAAEAAIAAEKIKYRDDAWFGKNYRPVDPNSPPTRKQDCGGNALEQLWGVRNVVVGAENFHDNLIKPSHAQEVVRVSPDGTIDWSKVQDKDVGIMFREGGTAGHIFVVKSAKDRTIVTKDGNERVREGELSIGDDLHNSYRGDIGIYRINPGSIKLSRK